MNRRIQFEYLPLIEIEFFVASNFPPADVMLIKSVTAFFCMLQFSINNTFKPSFMIRRGKKKNALAHKKQTPTHEHTPKASNQSSELFLR